MLVEKRLKDRMNMEGARTVCRTALARFPAWTGTSKVQIEKGSAILEVDAAPFPAVAALSHTIDTAAWVDIGAHRQMWA